MVGLLILFGSGDDVMRSESEIRQWRDVERGKMNARGVGVDERTRAQMIVYILDAILQED